MARAAPLQGRAAISRAEESERAPAAGQAAAAAPPAAASAGASHPVAGAQSATAGQSAADAAGTPAAQEPLAAQKALDVFAQSETVRESVYEQAKKKGDVLGTRVVEPAPQVQNAPAKAARSQYVSEPERLSGIAEKAEYGIIPRFTADRLSFLFYSRLKDGRIAGCSLDAARFRARIAGVVPGTWSAARILVILDEKGSPLAAPPASEGRDWRRPFVSQEVGEALPRWEAASYLTDPSSVAARARSSGLIIGILVVILFASVAGGGALVLTSLAAESRLARNKATFVTNVSHELKTPLTSIRLFVDMLRQGRQRDQAKAREYLARIDGETERLTRLINSVLDFSALEKGTRRYQPGQADLASVCRGIGEGERPRLEAAGFAVSLSAPEESVMVDADAEALKQIILNLLSNAEKYSPSVKEIALETAREAGMCVVHVRDRGVGVPERLREKIFQEFYRVDDSLTTRVKGTGLGLTIARRIARDHGGDVTCRPRDGGGSDFVLVLPAGSQGTTGEPGAAAARQGSRP
jgi:signal transduction histidine kinase